MDNKGENSHQQGTTKARTAHQEDTKGVDYKEVEQKWKATKVYFLASSIRLYGF